MLRGGDRFGFRLGAYDTRGRWSSTRSSPTRPTWAEATLDNGAAIAVDAAGSAYVTGLHVLRRLPDHAPAPSTRLLNGGVDAFVTKLDADRRGLVYSTYLGGSGSTRAVGIAVDSAGSAYVTGRTFSPTSRRRPAPSTRSLNGGVDAFVAKLDAERLEPRLLDLPRRKRPTMTAAASRSTPPGAPT